MHEADAGKLMHYEYMYWHFIYWVNLNLNICSAEMRPKSGNSNKTSTILSLALCVLDMTTNHSTHTHSLTHTHLCAYNSRKKWLCDIQLTCKPYYNVYNLWYGMEMINYDCSCIQYSNILLPIWVYNSRWIVKLSFNNHLYFYIYRAHSLSFPYSFPQSIIQNNSCSLCRSHIHSHSHTFSFLWPKPSVEWK